MLTHYFYSKNLIINEKLFTLKMVLSNTKSTSSNGHNIQMSDEEDEPPATAAEAVRHGEKFLRWLECCSDPSVTALQILQFRY